MKRLAACLGLASTGLLLALTAPPTNPFLLASQAMGDLKGRANYVLPVVRLRQLRVSYAAAGPAEWGNYLQALSNYETLVGETDSAAYRWQQLGVPPLAPITGTPLVVQPAASAILARTSTQQMVLFNEAHTQPKGRQLVSSLLPALYRQGFRYLALEALAAEDTAHLRQRGFPTLASGYYVAEPHMANLVREAQKLGFRLVAYDAMSSSREHDQARNLWTATLQRQPRARVLVLAGHAHINERPDTEFKSMAQWLRELSGIDPLTINQTDLDQAAISQLAPATGAWVVSDARWQPQKAPMLNDVYVINHLSLRDGKAFAAASQTISRLTIPADSLAPGAAYALLVYRQAEAQAVPNPVPVATQWLPAGVSTSIQLTLQPGRYVAEVHDEHGKCCWRQQLVIKQ
ncbi:hypothetical protein Q5H93_01635 [Hymenobacter sp. ASUV-10]|uniref:Erythromycin esterase family protein n=1 Tax=Hymenobacter aranciens TaxID=3063996 RepID=A0ABT9B6T6_9BACT|nr:hypothetical protein [Hymenobacter sp. ASUV-10]MDO7873414.1 hypothetical protein [Hymenobacter sp. ASUV-10]